MSDITYICASFLAHSCDVVYNICCFFSLSFHTEWNYFFSFMLTHTHTRAHRRRRNSWFWYENHSVLMFNELCLFTHDVHDSAIDRIWYFHVSSSNIAMHIWYEQFIRSLCADKCQLFFFRKYVYLSDMFNILLVEQAQKCSAINRKSDWKCG